MFKIGQRWLSEMEPNLGLGIIKEINSRSITVQFSLSEETRIYSNKNSPLKRVTFKIGDKIELKNGSTIIIDDITEIKGLFTYFDENYNKVEENEISDKISISSPVDKLLSGLINKNKNFQLREKVLEMKEFITSSHVRGFSGGRIELLGHQIYIAQEVTSRFNPRVMLSDETGLGKTIEASLIIHRLLLTEKIHKVLIVLPEPLVHQWFIELLRKFNLIFTIVDEMSFTDIKGDTEKNPFKDSQLIISGVSFISKNRIKKYALKENWDLVLFDEAHHLIENSDEYIFAENICAISKSVLLLTATPEQLGHKSHFNRLRLLDPNKYFDYDKFKKEEEHYLETSKYLNQIVDNSGNLTESDNKIIEKHFPNLANKNLSREKVIKHLIDQNGTGRNLFRNKRSVMEGFPTRKVKLYELKNSENSLLEWLKNYMIEDRNRKSILICGSQESAEKVSLYLKKYIGPSVTTFTENMSLILRDRSAAAFADDDGARIMICSEIGSEGRNFQFVHNLILFDLPTEPELLEQRIGRIDRIGQKNTISIHVPYKKNNRSEILTNWYNNGLNLFKRTVAGVYEIVEPIKSELLEIIDNNNFDKLDNLIKKTKLRKKEIEKKIELGRDRLLELNSYRKDISEETIDDIKTYIESDDIENILLSLFEYYGVEANEVGKRTYQLDFTMMNCIDFPMPPMKHDNFIITFSREIALSREDYEFITGDHPMVISLIDLFIGEGSGNSSSAIIKSKFGKQGAILEAIFIAEVICSKSLFIDRYFPQEPIRVVVDDVENNISAKFPKHKLNKEIINKPAIDMLSNQDVKNIMIPKMVKQAKIIAGEKLKDMIKYSIEDMEDVQKDNTIRLLQLKKINSSIKDKEIDAIFDETQELKNSIKNARLRLDSVRFIGFK